MKYTFYICIEYTLIIVSRKPPWIHIDSQITAASSCMVVHEEILIHKEKPWEAKKGGLTKFCIDMEQGQNYLTKLP